MSFEDLRQDLADLAETAMGITVHSMYAGIKEPHVGQVRWGGNGRDWLERDDETSFCSIKANLSILLTANAADLKGSQEWLEAKVAALHTIGGQTLARTGGVCGPVFNVTQPSRLADAENLLAVLISFDPIEHDL